MAARQTAIPAAPAWLPWMLPAAVGLPAAPDPAVVAAAAAPAAVLPAVLPAAAADAAGPAAVPAPLLLLVLPPLQCLQAAAAGCCSLPWLGTVSPSWRDLPRPLGCHSCSGWRTLLQSEAAPEQGLVATAAPLAVEGPPGGSAKCILSFCWSSAYCLTHVNPKPCKQRFCDYVYEAHDAVFLHMGGGASCSQ